MFCCFLPPRSPEIDPHIDEKKPLLTSSGNITPRINYKTIFSIPYARVIEDDKILMESSDLGEKESSGTYFLFNGSISEHEYEKGCFSFDDDTNVSPTPVVIATTTTNGHILFERVYQIEHVRAINSSSFRMHQINSSKTLLSNPISMARPFDEFAANSTTSNNPPDNVQNDNDTSTKTD